MQERYNFRADYKYVYSVSKKKNDTMFEVHTDLKYTNS